MVHVNTHRAKSTLARLLAAVEEHDGVVVICRNGKPIAELRRVLPPVHDDPADRTIVATAILHGLTVLTPDPKLGAYEGCTTAW